MFGSKYWVENFSLKCKKKIPSRKLNILGVIKYFDEFFYGCFGKGTWHHVVVLVVYQRFSKTL